MKKEPYNASVVNESVNHSGNQVSF